MKGSEQEKHSGFISVVLWDNSNKPSGHNLLPTAGIGYNSLNFDPVVLNTELFLLILIFILILIISLQVEGKLLLKVIGQYFEKYVYLLSSQESNIDTILILALIYKLLLHSHL